MTTKSRPIAYYIDDDLDDLEFLKEAIEVYDYDLKLFSDPDKFFRSLELFQEIPSFIFIDYNLSKANGCDVIRDIRKMEALKKLPLIIYSTASSYDTIKKAKECGANMFVTKPTSMPMLLRTLKGIIDTDWETRVITETNFVHLA